MQSLSAYSLSAYRLITRLAAPCIALFLHYRKLKGKEDPARIHERFGTPSKSRPAGDLIWLHAASIGEAISLLQLIETIHRLSPSSPMLLTTGTVTSAKLLAETLPAYVIHQFMPVDTPQSTERFLDYWQPSLGIFTESELWPNMIIESKLRGVKLALINARMSEKSFGYWQNQPEMIGAMLEGFFLIAAQTPLDAERYQVLGGNHIHTIGNLKYDAKALECDEALLANIQTAIAGRPCIVAASLHSGEDELLVQTHKNLQNSFPDLLTIIIPRHPNRGSEMQQSAKAVSSTVSRRSEGQLPDANCSIYIADSIGEMGLWYRLANVVVMGGSFIPHGGQNPLEPMRLNCPVIVGPHMFNFAEMVKQLNATYAILQVADAPLLADALKQMLEQKPARDAMVANAQNWLAATPTITDTIALKLLELLKPARPT